MVGYKLIFRQLGLYAVRNAGEQLRILSMKLQYFYRIRSAAFGQNGHLDSSSDTMDIARRSTIGRSSKVLERTSLAPEIDESKSIMTLAQR